MIFFTDQSVKKELEKLMEDEEWSREVHESVVENISSIKNAEVVAM